MERRKAKRVKTGRRPPPPEATGREAAYYEEKIASAARVTVHLRGGETIEGVLESHDRELIVICQASGPVVIRKADIRFLACED